MARPMVRDRWPYRGAHHLPKPESRSLRSCGGKRRLRLLAEKGNEARSQLETAEQKKIEKHPAGRRRLNAKSRRVVICCTWRPATGTNARKKRRDPHVVGKD